MTIATRRIIAALLGALTAWAVGTYAIGMADVLFYTASGPVNMSDVDAVRTAGADPSFTAVWRWKHASLTGMHWGLTIPYGAAILAAVVITAIGHFRAARKRP
jgi:hypothetical protein